MTEATDADLLHDYAHRGSSAAFRVLVARHVDLVYSVARRQSGSAALAEDVAQAVFVTLAQSAAQIPRGTPLVAWLHVVTRRTASNALRDAARRHAREQAAAQLASPAMNSPDADWSALEPLLDEAVESLPEADRAALLLRYFENKSLRDIGAALGVSDDTAQKRVSRALDRLRTFFLRRGVSVSAAGLATDLSAHALLTAPGTLSAQLAAHALASASLPSSALSAAQKVALTAAQKTLLAAAALALVVGAFEGWKLFAQGRDFAALTAQNDRARAAVSDLSLRHTATLARRQALQSQLAAQQTAAADASIVTEIRARLARVKTIKQLLAKNPALDLPEIRLLEDNQWLEALQGYDLKDSDQLEAAVLNLRAVAKNEFASSLVDALVAYLKNSHDRLPASIAELAPYFSSTCDPVMLDRYELLHSGNLADLPHGSLPSSGASHTGRQTGVSPDRQWPALIAEKTSGLLSNEQRLYVSSTGWVVMPQIAYLLSHLGPSLDKAARNYEESPADPSDPTPLLAAFDPPLDAETERQVRRIFQDEILRQAQSPFRALKP